MDNKLGAPIASWYRRYSHVTQNTTCCQKYANQSQRNHNKDLYSERLGGHLNHRPPPRVPWLLLWPYLRHAMFMWWSRSLTFQHCSLGENTTLQAETGPWPTCALWVNDYFKITPAVMVLREWSFCLSDNRTDRGARLFVTPPCQCNKTRETVRGRRESWNYGNTSKRWCKIIIVTWVKKPDDAGEVK